MSVKQHKTSPDQGVGYKSQVDLIGPRRRIVGNGKRRNTDADL